ncbi:MAG: endonuclease domain-containing protein [Kiloniellales bacterium]
MANERARTLRGNPTGAEKALWRRLRQRQVENARFRRQQPIGPYVVDFFCPERNLVIEVDGGQHALQAKQDTFRTRWLEQRGHRVLRFWNNEVLENIDGVVVRIAEELR